MELYICSIWHAWTVRDYYVTYNLVTVDTLTSHHCGVHLDLRVNSLLSNLNVSNNIIISAMRKTRHTEYTILILNQLPSYMSPTTVTWLCGMSLMFLHLPTKLLWLRDRGAEHPCGILRKAVWSLLNSSGLSWPWRRCWLVVGWDVGSSWCSYWYGDLFT